jgi:hypothetical protein
MDRIREVAMKLADKKTVAPLSDHEVNTNAFLVTECGG